MKNYIFSRHRPRTKKKKVVFVSEDISAFANKLKSEKGKDIWLVGGGELVRSFLEADLIDEMILSIHPLLLGEGIRLFDGAGRRCDFELLGCKPYSTGLIQLHYARRPSAP